QQLVQAMKDETDPGRRSDLANTFAQVAKNAKPEQAGSLFRQFAVSMHTKADSWMLSTWAQAITNLPEPLEPADLANVLKYPNCTGDVQSAVLRRLAKVLQISWQPNDNPWRIITHDKFKPYVNRPLVAPPDWPTK